MTEQTLPLLELFTRLRQADLPLGIDDYQHLLRALQAGFGLPDLDALARLCRTLWVKSHEEGLLFDYHFKQVMTTDVVNEITRTASSLSPQSASGVIPPQALSGANVSQPGSASNLTLKLEDEVQAAQAVLQAAGEDEIPYRRFVRTDEYFPVTRRQMKQCWRYLRHPVREGPAVELDVEATVQEVGRHGMLLEPVFVPRRTNRAELLLLIDQGGSMVPFHSLSRRLAETALRGGRLSRAGIYYFRNYPAEYLYHDAAYQEAEPVENVLARLHYGRTGALIFSDAGAARGGFNQERLEMTRDFLHQLRQRVRYMAWLNPMPRSRWPDATAGKIMSLIPMFDISRRGLDNAISVLRGRPVPYAHLEASL